MRQCTSANQIRSKKGANTATKSSMAHQSQQVQAIVQKNRKGKKTSANTNMVNNSLVP